MSNIKFEEMESALSNEDLSGVDWEERKPRILYWLDKFLNGDSVQYKVGNAIDNEKSQWHNLTWNSLKDLVHTSIVFREKPKYVTLNGVEFKTKESLLKFVERNFNLDEEK